MRKTVLDLGSTSHKILDGLTRSYIYSFNISFYFLNHLQ